MGDDRAQQAGERRDRVVGLIDYMAAIRRDCVAMARASQGNLDVRVPGCPGWDVAELVRHTGDVHRSWATVVERRLQTTEEVRALPDYAPGKGEDLLAWFSAGGEHLIAVLEDANPGTEVWSWSHQRDVGFVRRRMAQETAVHCWDAQDAAGSPQDIEPALAADGIDEFLHVWVTAEESPPTGGGETIHLHQTDGDGEWLLTLAPGGFEASSGHAKADVAARGSGSDLLLMLWRRVPPSRLEVFGETPVLDRFLAWVDLD